MNRRILFLLLLSPFLAFSQSYAPDWYVSGIRNNCLQIAQDDDQVYLFGNTASANVNIDLDLSAGTNIVNLPYYGAPFVTCVDTAGNYLWSDLFLTQIPPGGDLSMVGMPNGGFVLSGYCDSTDMDFDPGPGYAPVQSSNLDVAFIAFYDRNGNYLSHLEFADGQMNSAYNRPGLHFLKMSAAGPNKLFLTGSYCGSVDFDPGIGVDMMTSTGGCRQFMMCIDLQTRQYLWAKEYCGWTSNFAQIALKFDGENLVALYRVTGTGSIDLEPNGPGGEIQLQGAGNVESIIHKFDTLGNYVLGGAIHGNLGVFPTNISVDHNKNVYFVGFGQDNIASIDCGINGGAYPLSTTGKFKPNVVVKYDWQLTPQWAKVFYGITPLSSVGMSSVVTRDSLVGIIGSFKDSIYYDPGSGTTQLGVNHAQQSLGQTIILVFSEDGTLKGTYWDQGMPTTYQFSYSQGIDFFFGTHGDIYQFSRFFGPNDLDPGPNVMSTLIYENIDSEVGSYLQHLEKVNLVGVPDGIKSTGIKVWPNPSHGVLKLESDSQINEVHVFNARGIEVLMLKDQLNRLIEIDMSGFAKGLYFVSLKSESGRKSSKLVLY